MKASIILPTYNEKYNIVELIEAIFQALSDQRDYEIVVVDDGSTDGSKDTILRCRRR